MRRNTVCSNMFSSIGLTPDPVAEKLTGITGLEVNDIVIAGAGITENK
ncbi:MAG: hypothetical protein QXV17_07105 [Candidatus Micrarchaeaceae archaeon]